MILLDTNVVSEPTKPQPNSDVLQWLDRQSAESLAFSATSLSEVLAGVEILLDGKRKENLRSVLHGLIRLLFEDRVIAFDHLAAMEYARVVAQARGNGYAISVSDAQIAAIAAVHGFSVATRDTAPFIAAGVPVIDPWQL